MDPAAVALACASDVSARDAAGRDAFPHLVNAVSERVGDPSARDFLRAIANSCIDHDENRARLDELKFIPVLGAHLQWCARNSDADADCRRIAAGVVLNIANDCETIQQQMVDAGVLSDLVLLCGAENTEEVQIMALNALEIFADRDTGHADIAKIDNIAEIIGNVCTSEDEEISGLAQAIFVPILEQNERLCDALYNNSHTFSRLLCIPSASENSAVVRGNTGKIVTLALSGGASVDDNALHELSALVPVFKQWLGSDIIPVRCAGLLSLGNLARTDENCGYIASDCLEEIMKLAMAQNALECHAAMSALRNLAVAKPLKNQLYKRDIISCLLPHMDSLHMPVRYLISNILKSLTFDSDTCDAMCHDSRAVQMMIDLSMSDDEGTQSEAARAVGNLFRFATNKQDVANCVQEIGGYACLRLLLQSKHAMLQHEGILAVCHVASLGDDEIAAVLDDPHMDVKQCVQDIAQQSPSPEIRSNAIALLNLLRTST